MQGTLIITIDLDNDAFQDALCNLEIADILRRIVKEYETDTAIERLLHDINGNTVGRICVHERLPKAVVYRD